MPKRTTDWIIECCDKTREGCDNPTDCEDFKSPRWKQQPFSGDGNPPTMQWLSSSPLLLGGATHCELLADPSKNRESDIGSRSLERRGGRRFLRRARRFLLEGHSLELVLYSAGLLVTSCGNAIYFKKMTNAMPNYGWFLNQVTSFSYVPIFGIIVFLSMFQGTVTREMREFPKHRFAVMGLLDGLFCLLGILGGAFTTGPAQLVLGQAVIPVTLIFSSIILGHQFHLLQYVGSAVIILGVVAAKWALLFPGLHFVRDMVKDEPLFNLLYAASAVPGALSQIYKEYAFTAADLDVNYMQFWTAAFQFLIGVLLVPVNALPLLGPEQVALREIPSLVKGGAKCLFLSENTIVKNCGSDGQMMCDSCSGAWVPISIYLFFNILYNVFSLAVIKHGGAALSFIIAALRLPLTTVCFYSTAIMGKDATSPNIYDFLGLFLLLLGLACYRYGSAAVLIASAAVAADSTTSTALTLTFFDEASRCLIDDEGGAATTTAAALVEALSPKHRYTIGDIKHKRPPPHSAPTPWS